ncbi:MAG: hypothetical protein A2Y95_12530 [Deltaproteobacteria bacterium RBG_13_65_10]|nr:MAG: hypothetical protein A2Y95_12530 [Deltaproteobacteria bacterium RBG_13_65_10]
MFLHWKRSAKPREDRQRLSEASEAGRVLQVEIVGGLGRNDLTGQCGLAALARADEGHDPAWRRARRMSANHRERGIIVPQGAQDGRHDGVTF